MRRVFERYLREDEERRLFAALRRMAGTGNHEQLIALRDYGWMRLLRYTGIRVGTLAGLTVGDAKEALCSHYLTLRPEITKGHRAGKVYCTRRALESLRVLLRVRRAQGQPDLMDAPLICSTKRRAMSVRSFQTRMRYWAGEAGLEVRPSPHWWRHTLAKRLMRNSTADDPRAVVMHTLNHADINATVVYTMPDREDIERALDEVNT